MRILFINSPIRLNAPPNCIPYGLGTIASLLRERNHEVGIYDVNALRPEPRETEAFLRTKKWDIIGLSGLITTYGYQKWIAGVIKEAQPDAFLVSGGGLATSIPDLVMDRMPVDALVIGEGEITMDELASALRSQEGLAGVKGLVWRDGNNVVSNKPRPNIADLDSIPFPAWDLLPMDVYLKNPVWAPSAENSSGFPEDVRVTRSMNIISSRGCPHNCNFCYHLFGRGKYRFRSAANIIEEVRILARDYGVDFVGFVDDNFMASAKRAVEFCRMLEDEPYEITWGCHGRVDSARPELLRTMRKAGCVWIGYGIESGSQKILDAMGKKTTVKQAEQAVTATREAGVFANTTFIYGYPGEDEDTIRETMEFKAKLGIDVTSFYAIPYPRTPLFEKHVRHLIGDMEEFVLSLGNATDFAINLTKFSDNEYHRFKAINDGLITSEHPEK